MAADYGIVSVNWQSPAPTETIIRASNLGYMDKFGNAVAISGDYAIVGAYSEEGSSNNIGECGAAYIFERTGGVWGEKQLLRASNVGEFDQFGWSVAISGNYAIVGANNVGSSNSNTNVNNGGAYIFERTGGVWSEKAILQASNAGGGHAFGQTVGISGNYAIVGSPYEDSTSTNTTFNSGAAYIFERDGSGNWIQNPTILRASNLEANDNFGYSVAIDGNYAIVGAIGEAGSSNQSYQNGATYVFERNTTTGVWIQNPIILRGSDIYKGGKEASSIAISGNYIIVGAYNQNTATLSNSGAAYIFERNTITGVWSQTPILRASDQSGSDQFGISVAINGKYAIVGANFEDGTGAIGANSGAAYIFERNDAGTWIEKKILRASNTTPADYFGESVAISGNYVIVGATGEDTNNASTMFESGAAYIYTGTVLGFAPTPLSFVNNTLTITNSISATDNDPVSFSLVSGAKLYPFSVTNFSGTGTVTYSLDISGGANVVSGTFSAANFDILKGSIITASGNTTYYFTLTANAAITYSIVCSLLNSPTNILLSATSINELKPIGTTIGTLTCDNPNNNFITYSVSDTANFSITGSTLKTNAIFDFESVSSYTITITGLIGGLTSSNTITISVINVLNEAAEIRNQNLQGLALKTAAASQSNPPITAADLKAAGYTATELKAANYTILNLKVAGYTTIEMAAAGYTEQQINEVMSWTEDSTANRLDASYIEGYLDISGGNVTVRGSSCNLNMASGNARFSGATTFTQPYIYNSDISLNNRLFVIGDVSMGSGNANITGNISINGTLSAGSYNTGTIALNAIYPAFASNMTYSQKIQMNGDVSMNGNAQFSGSTTLRIGNQIQFSDGTIIRTTNREANGTTFKASKFNNMTVVGAFASNPVLTPSDYRIKTNVQSLDETHVLDNLRPVKYYQTQSERNDIGFLAHELQEYYPDLVEGEMDGEQMQSVNYNGILALLVNEVKRLKQNIKHTKAVIAAKKASA